MRDSHDLLLYGYYALGFFIPEPENNKIEKDCAAAEAGREELKKAAVPDKVHQSGSSWVLST
jgi:hypothetical protein